MPYNNNKLIPVQLYGKAKSAFRSEIHTTMRPIQCIVSMEGNHQHCPFPSGFRDSAGGGPSHSHTQHAQKNFTCGSGDILVDRHTQTYSLQYFATAPVGKVKI